MELKDFWIAMFEYQKAGMLMLWDWASDPFVFGSTPLRWPLRSASLQRLGEIRTLWVKQEM